MSQVVGRDCASGEILAKSEKGISNLGSHFIAPRCSTIRQFGGAYPANLAALLPAIATLARFRSTPRHDRYSITIKFRERRRMVNPPPSPR